MNIHVVQQGETITLIAERYGVPIDRLILDNGLQNPYNLVVGQSIVIVYPDMTYEIQEGDTLESIARIHNVSVLQLLRNNPFLSDRDYLYPGETLVISYGEKKKRISTNGYANPFINRDILRKTLPYLTYLTIFGYIATENADIIEPEDTELISMAKQYNVAPVMLLSTLTFRGLGSAEAAYNILYNENIVNRYIYNISSTLRRKGLYGVSFIYSFLTSDNVEIYNSFTRKITERLNQEGFVVFTSIPPMFTVETNVITFERINYMGIGSYTNQLVVMNYNWGYNFGPPMPVESVYMMRMFLEYLITMVPQNKMVIGIPVLGYDWQLPYEIGVTRANSVTNEAVINLAIQTGAEIQFDEVSQTPYFEYIEYIAGIPRKNIVWFIDARSIEALQGLLIEYNLPGISIWNIMTYFPQLWLIINSQYDIETVFNI